MEIVTVEALKKYLDEHDDGVLKNGDGTNKKGHFCAMNLAAVVAGEPFSDRPKCVHPALRGLCIRLNDGRWDSNEQRTEVLLPLIAECMGTAYLTFKSSALVELAIRKFVPMAFEAAASVNPKYADELRAAGKKCAEEGTRKSAIEARRVGQKVRDAAAAYAAAYRAQADLIRKIVPRLENEK